MYIKTIKIFFFSFIIFSSFFIFSPLTFAQESSTAIPENTGTVLDIPGANPDTFVALNSTHLSMLEFFSLFLNYIQERFWALWDWFISIL